MPEPNTKPATVANATPLLKWPGGKRWFLPRALDGIRAFLDETGGHYVEPFCGGAAMALALEWDRMVLGDAAAEIIEFYQTVVADPAKVAWQLSALAIEGVEKENYYRVRDMRPDTALGRAARILYLNRLSFNGLYRVNKSGDYNVPYGDQVYRKSVVNRRSRDAITSLFPHKGKIEAVARALGDAELYAGDFAPLIDATDEGDLVYADPPYDEQFDQYTAEGFKLQDQVRLAGALYEANKRNVAFIAHNSNTEHVRELYLGWAHVFYVDERRAINRNGADRTGAKCVVITNLEELLSWG